MSAKIDKEKLFLCTRCGNYLMLCIVKSSTGLRYSVPFDSSQGMVTYSVLFCFELSRWSLMLLNYIMFIFYNCHKCISSVSNFRSFIYTCPTFKMDSLFEICIAKLFWLHLFYLNHCKIICFVTLYIAYFIKDNS